MATASRKPRISCLGGIDGWIDALDQHHNYSFRHSMFVCGTLSYFCHAMGIDGGELHQLTVGGLLHDIGKSMIPLEILDKPGRLDECEWRTMKRHPEHSRDILLREMGLEADVIAMVVHHHEKLDGGGYPDCLSGARINDHVRLTAIADVFSALIDKRAYKGSMRKEDALDLMTSSRVTWIWTWSANSGVSCSTGDSGAVAAENRLTAILAVRWRDSRRGAGACRSSAAVSGGLATPRADRG